MYFFIQELFSRPDFFFMWTTIVVFSICCHEYAHARVALWQGDSTAADNGHLTLNPLVQMGPFSLIMLIVVGIAWGAVPVSPARMKHRYSPALVSFAGPAMNVLLALTSFIILVVLKSFETSANAEQLQIPIFFFRIGAVLNIVLFLFNMMPVPALDGWSVYAYFFPKMYEFERSELAKGLVLAVIIIAFTTIQYLFAFAIIIIGLASDLCAISLKALFQLLGIT